MRRLALVVLATVVLAAGTAVAAGAWWLSAGATVLRVVRTSSGSHDWSPDQRLYVLLLGDDLRAGAGCGCTDAIHLVGIPPGGGRATMLNLPRDTRVPIPGRGLRRINEAYRSGPRAAAEVIGRFVGVTISYVVVTGFDHLPAMVDELGGVTVDVPVAMADRNSGASFARGPTRMDGADALAFSRNRYLPGGDFTRTDHQGVLILSMLAELRARGTSTADTLRYLAVLLRHTRTDGISTAELYRLGRLALSIDPSRVRSVTMPGSLALIDATSYVIAGSAASSLFADFADDGVLQSH